MNIKTILISVILILSLSGLCNASGWTDSNWYGDDDLPIGYPNSGWLIVEAYETDGASACGSFQFIELNYGTGSAHTLYISGTGYMIAEHKACTYGTLSRVCIRYYKSGGWHYIYPQGHNTTYSFSGNIDTTITTETGSPYFIGSVRSNSYIGETHFVYTKLVLYISPNLITNYTISGSIECIDNVTIYTKINNSYIQTGFNTSASYSFGLIEGVDYKLVFSDSHEYEFTCTETFTYDHDGCVHTTYRFEESCENLILDSEGYYCEYTGDVISCNWFEESNGILDIVGSSANKIEVYTNTFIGQTGWFIDPVVSDMTYVLKNPYIAWNLKVIVQNESDGTLIDDAMVRVNQSCYCTNGYSTRQKMTINGHTDFSDMSLQDAGLFVMASGYKILDETSTSYSAFLSGRMNFSSKTWIVKLAPSWSENSSTWYETNNTVNIHFRNEDGNRTSKILDTNSEVYLYYENNNTNEEDMTLKFQSSSTHTYFIDVQSWNIPYGEIGHKTIAKVDFTPWDYSYRALIYNASIYGWNMTIPLTVRNATKESEQHYENLTTDLWFMFASDGKIDYRSDMNIVVHACSNNTTLMNMDIELFKDGSLLCYKNLTWAIFINADPQFYYIWSPAYSYESGSNYSVRMYGFDRTLLETNYVDCYTDAITRKNKLTIIVKNQYGTNLNNAFVYLEEYGSIPTGTNYYASFEGLGNEYYRFKATKPDHVGTGWDDITLSDSDEIVTYILTTSDSEEGRGTQPQKIDNNELQNLYLIIMAFLLIFIIIGGFLYAI